MQSNEWEGAAMNTNPQPTKRCGTCAAFREGHAGYDSKCHRRPFVTSETVETDDYPRSHSTTTRTLHVIEPVAVSSYHFCLEWLPRTHENMDGYP